MRILIIEDDKDLAQLTKLALEKENFTVDIYFIIVGNNIFISIGFAT